LLFQFNYQSHKSQIKMLQHHADNGKQRVTVTCRDSPIVLDKANNSYDNAVTLLSFDEELMSAKGKRPFRYRVVKDTCQVSDLPVFFFLLANTINSNISI
jgi:hypothetical protein